VGKCSKGIAASEGFDGLGSCGAHHVTISPKEDCGGTAGAVGEGEGWEKVTMCLTIDIPIRSRQSHVSRACAVGTN
jgi:hypothetical protein